MAAAAILLIGPVSCIPSHAAFLRVGVGFRDTAPKSLTVLDLSLQHIRRAQPELNTDNMAVYYRGRSPVPFRLVDKSGDGKPDHVRVKITPESARAWLVFVSPGTPSKKEPQPGGTVDPNLTLFYGTR